MYTHAREEEVQESSTGSIKDMVLMPPSIKREVHFLVVNLQRAEGLPAMDSNVLGKKTGIDAFVDVSSNPLLIEYKKKKSKLIVFFFSFYLCLMINSCRSHLQGRMLFEAK